MTATKIPLTKNTASAQPLISVTDLTVQYKRRGRGNKPVQAVDGVTFRIAPGETVGLVGESGSGKSTIGRAMLGLAPIAHGEIKLDGQDITHSKAGDRKHIAKDLQVIFQDPYSSLNPARTIGKTLTEPLEIAGDVSSGEALQKVRSLLGQVGLPKDSANRYPHAFSGGQRQRVAIARAVAISPKLIVCDEAISALDVVTQAQVLNLLKDLQQDTGVGYLFIAHNLPVVSYLCDRVLVLYRGRVMEQGDATAVHERPLHPYTKALRAAVPVPNVKAQRELRRQRSEVVSVSTSAAEAPPEVGCPFAPRCPRAADVCWTRRPIDSRVDDRLVACHLFDAESGHPEAPVTVDSLGESSPTTDQPQTNGA